jgi:hypothetical protein
MFPDKDKILNITTTDIPAQELSLHSHFVCVCSKNKLNIFLVRNDLSFE